MDEVRRCNQGRYHERDGCEEAEDVLRPDEGGVHLAVSTVLVLRYRFNALSRAIVAVAKPGRRVH
jgi:hypothetical protein